MENDLSDVGEKKVQKMLRQKSRVMTRHYPKVARENLKREISDYESLQIDGNKIQKKVGFIMFM